MTNLIHLTLFRYQRLFDKTFRQMVQFSKQKNIQARKTFKGKIIGDNSFCTL